MTAAGKHLFVCAHRRSTGAQRRSLAVGALDALGHEWATLSRSPSGGGQVVRPRASHSWAELIEDGIAFGRTICYFWFHMVRRRYGIEA